jgi:acetyl-CoA carboxylase carboxyl transferase subunit alpha
VFAVTFGNPFDRIKKPYHGEAARLLKQLHELRSLPSLPGVGYEEEIQKIEEKLEELRERRSSDTVWKQVERARHKDRPQTLDYISHAFPDFVELHGDRLGADDPALVGGMATLDGRSIMIMGHQKGHDLKERQARNFGMGRPEGYRKAQRLALMAEKFQMPVVTLVDTPGAFPGADAEEGGQAAALARTLQVFAGLAVPTVAVIIGEGGSGGAVALALCDRVYMLENAVYSVITPEGCAAILWRDPAAASLAAEALKLTAPDLFELGVIDGIVSEPRKGAHKHHRATAKVLQRQLEEALRELELTTTQERKSARRRKFLTMGRTLGMPGVGLGREAASRETLGVGQPG